MNLAAERISPRAISVRIKHNDYSSTEGQRRHDLRIGPTPSYVNSSLTHLNRTLIEPPATNILQASAHALRDLQNPVRKARSNSAVATHGIVTFGTLAQGYFLDLDPPVQDDAVLDVARSIADRFRCRLVGTVLHFDEAAPHAHLTYECRSWEDGVPFSRKADASTIHAMQDTAAEAIARYEPRILRGERKADKRSRGRPSAETINRSVRQLHQELPGEIAELELRIETLDKRVQERQKRLALLDEELLQGQAHRDEWDRLAEQYMLLLNEHRAALDAEREALAQLGASLPPRTPIPIFPGSRTTPED